VINMK